jgi:hypothetical protein
LHTKQWENEEGQFVNISDSRIAIFKSASKNVRPFAAKEDFREPTVEDVAPQTS